MNNANICNCMYNAMLILLIIHLTMNTNNVTMFIYNKGVYIILKSSIQCVFQQLSSLFNYSINNIT